MLPFRADRRVALGLLGAALVGACCSARADDAGGVSDWAETDHARLRLIDAGPLAPDSGKRLVGLQIELDPGFITYWRTPGEAGVAPVASFDGSRNLAAATLLFPAPSRLDEGGAEAFGYADGVVFPIEVAPASANEPVSLVVALSFSICAKLCLPASGTVRLALGDEGRGPEAGLVRAALTQVPAPRRLGEGTDLRIESVAPGPERSSVVVRAQAPEGTKPDLFVEAPEPWYFAVSRGASTSGQAFTFSLTAVAGPKGGGRAAVQLTLATGAAAITVPVDLDVTPRTP